MAPGVLGYLLFLLEYQWKYFFGFAGGVEGQERRSCYIFLETTLDINSISPSSFQFVWKNCFA